MSRSGRGYPKASFVDESLFGNTKPSSRGGPVTSQVETLDRKTAPAGTMAAAEVTTLRKADLDRMLKASPIMTAEDKALAKKEAEARREQAQAVSKARKEKMLKLEEEAKKNSPPTETALLKQQVDVATLSRAQHLLQEEKDDVKRMNQMMLYSKCVTIRDAQIEEKRQMMQENEDDNRKQDLMMEIERIKALEEYETREKQRLDERRKGAKVLEDQINEREKERVRQEELRDQERIQMLREIERLKEMELQAQIEKKLQAKELMEQVAAANSEQIKRKELMKIREKQEEVKITQYIRAKELREQELAAEKERIAREKEMETARLRSMQERANDKQSEMDELRARRYQEAKEREWRAKERATAERQAAMTRELADAREAQKNSKFKQRADMAHVEHDDFMRVLAVNRAKEADDMMQTATQLTINQKYKEELLAQIQANDEKRKKDRQDYLEEGARLRQQAELDKQRLLQIKAMKLQQLETAGVPAKYQAELERMKIKV